MSSRALLTALALALAIAGCGGGGDSEATSAETTVSKTQRGAAGEQLKASGGRQEKPTETPPRSPVEPNPPIAPERTPGSKAIAPGVPTTKGGDNSVQAFGTEGEQAEAEQATENLRAYLSARAQGDWTAACEAASKQFREQLEAATTTPKGEGEPSGCAQTLSVLYAKVPGGALQEAAQVDQILSFRVREDGYAYLVYEGQGEVRFVAMANDDGQWKINVPEPEAFESAQGEAQ